MNVKSCFFLKFNNYFHFFLIRTLYLVLLKDNLFEKSTKDVKVISYV